jgi:predicted MFS family arabinose efflux permease
MSRASQAAVTSASPSGGATFWVPVLLAGFILMITMGVRQTVGLFLHPIVHATTMNVAELSLALAIGQLMWGACQPLFGALADKKSPFLALLTGAILMACGQFGTIWAASFWPITAAQGLLSPAGAAAGSFPVLIGIVAGRLTADNRSMAGGLINAGGSTGQFIFAPAVQALMSWRGFYAGLVFLGLSSLVSIIPAWFLCRRKVQDSPPRPGADRPEAKPPDTLGLRRQLRIAANTPSYILLHAGFFTCGFHVAFLTTHLPGEISLCGQAASVSAISLSIIGLSNIAGSISVGFLGKHLRLKCILAALYAFRALMIAVYLLSPRTETTFYIFAVTTGLTWLATVPPTAGLVGKLFGTQYLATLFGLTLLTHQVGAFLGAWFGGLAMQYSGNFLWVWHMDIALALFAALVNLPNRKEKPTVSSNRRLVRPQ